MTTHPEVLAHLRRAGRKGAKARNAALTPAQRQRIARMGARARWRKYRAERAAKKTA